MTPIEHYQEQLRKGFITEDPQQLKVLEQLQSLYEALIQEQRKRARRIHFFRKPRLVRGMYIWGGVGIGKTFMMDCFYNSLPFKEKMRMHFHSFMRMIHQQLRIHQGEKNPLQVIARNIAKQHLVLCFDELYVNDIADAMILARLFSALFSHGVCLVATSNSMPDDLYKKGLQRKLFLPAIELIKEHTHVVHVSTVSDYRLRYLKDAGVFYTPNDELAENKMEKLFSILSSNQPVFYEPIEISDRRIPIRKQSEDVVWFDFQVICNIPRSQQDYLAIAEHYETVFISDFVPLPSHANDRISLLIRMIDVFYDARVRLVFSSATTVDQLYTEGRMLADFARACSRLIEMQSANYFSVKHI